MPFTDAQRARSCVSPGGDHRPWHSSLIYSPADDSVSTLRLFATPDASACLEVFDSNVPQYFGTHERADFSNYLLQHERAHDYLVVERAGRIVACGGLMRTAEDTAAFCWGMVDRRLHRQGLGNILALTRVAQAHALGVRRLTLSTSQHTRGFYAAQGFIVTAIVPDGHGPGLDAVHMERPMAPR
jgi:hypothetical protein